ncbi:MAG: RidA family protein [Neomegalonema sp.]|nr:RidA family protein [Neomegalonema sp.]
MSNENLAGLIERRLAEKGLQLPEAPAPAANYVPYVVSGDLVFISGQVSILGDRKWIGALGKDASLADGIEAAQACALNLIAQLRAATGNDLNRVAQILRVGGFVNAAPSFTDHPEVINGASDLLAELFAPRGAHARAAVGCASLPRGVMVEIEMTAKLV